MKLLIDGYNLLFQSDLAGKGQGAAWLLGARKRLLELLEHRLPADSLRSTQVVFDASRRSEFTEDHVRDSGMTVTFAADHPEADDLLEQLIRAHSHPKSLTVVSSDQRVRRCARARRASAVDSESFLNHLQQQPPSLRTENEQADKQDLEEHRARSEPQADEVQYWLEQFSDERD